jgi:pyrimidine deaminase RibD-like protein
MSGPNEYTARILHVIREYLSLEGTISSDDLASQLRRIGHTEKDEQLSDRDRQFMELAVQQGELQRDRYGDDDGGDRPNPFVGCVVVTQNGKLAASFRGQENRNDHAEYIALEKMGLSDQELVGAEVFTTLEPCSERGPNKTSCAEWIIKKRVRRVAVALWDVDPRGQGLRKLARAGIEITHFPTELVKRVLQQNAKFLASRIVDEELESIKKVERYYEYNRPKIQNVFREKDVEHGLRDFPLITAPGFILEAPQSLSQIMGSELSCSLSKDCFPNSHFDSDELWRVFIGATYSDFKASYLEREHRGPHLHDGYTYRLMKIETHRAGINLNFARSKYLGFIDTCEALAFEASAFALSIEEKNNKPYVMNLRGRVGSVFDLTNRNAILGINSATVLIDRKNGRCSLIAHRRRQVAEAMNTIHVVPAGTFQPLASDRLGGWDDVAWDRDFSLLDNIVREFMEEVLGMGGKIRFAARIGDWRTVDEEVESAYNLLMAAITEETGSNTKCRLWFFGLGFDPVNWKPEMLTAIVMDREFFYALRPQWSEEGQAQNIELSEYEIRNIIEYPNASWLSAGLACVHMVRAHYATIRTCLN